MGAWEGEEGEWENAASRIGSHIAGLRLSCFLFCFFVKKKEEGEEGEKQKRQRKGGRTQCCFSARPTLISHMSDCA